MKKKMSEKHKIMAYVLKTDVDLNRNNNISQRKIGNVLGVSQSTISRSLKDTKNDLRIFELEREISQLKGKAIKNDVEPLSLGMGVNEYPFHKNNQAIQNSSLSKATNKPIIVEIDQTVSVSLPKTKEKKAKVSAKKSVKKGQDYI